MGTDRRPRFKPTFWGENGIEWIYTQTAGWPHLVQLLTNIAVDLTDEPWADTLIKKHWGWRGADLSYWATPVLSYLLYGETQSEPETVYIVGFRTKDTQAPNQRSDHSAPSPSSDHHRKNNDWRLKVSLMLQWLRTKGRPSSKIIENFLLQS